MVSILEVTVFGYFLDKIIVWFISLWNRINDEKNILEHLKSVDQFHCRESIKSLVGQIWFLFFSSRWEISEWLTDSNLRHNCLLIIKRNGNSKYTSRVYLAVALTGLMNFHPLKQEIGFVKLQVNNLCLTGLSDAWNLSKISKIEPLFPLKNKW